jgi:hypothetical protein
MADVPSAQPSCAGTQKKGSDLFDWALSAPHRLANSDDRPREGDIANDALIWRKGTKRC